MNSNVPPFDPPLTPEEQAQVEQLSPSDIEEIDRALLASVVPRWRKVARVVLDAMDRVGEKFPDIPDLFYGQRAMLLAERGLLESQGDLRRMRYSEVRFAQNRESPPG